MSLPYFFIASISEANTIILPEETSKHCIQVLRMKEGEQLQLTDGKGNVTTTRISDANKKHCLVNIEEKNYQKPHSKKILIAHYENDAEKNNITSIITESETQILIGPEGDFTNLEIKQALENNYVQVSLGQTRLRSETAGVVAATLLMNRR